MLHDYSSGLRYSLLQSVPPLHHLLGLKSIAEGPLITTQGGMPQYRKVQKTLQMLQLHRTLRVWRSLHPAAKPEAVQSSL